LAAEEEALSDRAAALKAYLDNGDKESLARTQAITLGLTVSPETSKKPDDKSGHAVLNDVDSMKFEGLSVSPETSKKPDDKVVARF